MSSLIDFDDLYEEFLALTSSSSSLHSPDAVLQVSESGSFPYSRSEEPGPCQPEFEEMNNNLSTVGSQEGNPPPPYQPPWMPSYRDYWGQHGVVPYNRPQVSVIDTYSYPTGIEVVFRKLPADCQAILRQSDIPDAARDRGYFTVAELLTLKRTIVCRYTGKSFPHPQLPSEPNISIRRGVKRAHEGEKCEQVSVIRSTSSITGVGEAMKSAMKVLDLDDQQVVNRQ